MRRVDVVGALVVEDLSILILIQHLHLASFGCQTQLANIISLTVFILQNCRLRIDAQRIDVLWRSQFRAHIDVHHSASTWLVVCFLVAIVALNGIIYLVVLATRVIELLRKRRRVG